VPSRTRLGVMYLAGYGIKRNTSIALQLFEQASEEGERDAQCHLAGMYLRGVGVEKDVGKAIEWYTKAAEKGQIRAQAALATLLDSALAGSRRDPAKAEHWLRLAAQQSHKESQFSLAQRLASSQPAESFDWYRQAANGGHAAAQMHVGLTFADDTLPASAGLELSDAERMATAANYLSQAAEQGNVAAQCRLGFMCFHGMGTKEDKSTGIMWLTNAAEAHYMDAQLMLGSIAYDEHAASVASGSGDAANKLKTAKHYFDKVLENGNKQCTTLPSGSLPLLVRWTQDAALPSAVIKRFKQITGKPWLGDIVVLLRALLKAENATPSNTAPSSTN